VTERETAAKTTVPKAHVWFKRNPGPGEWIPFEWDEPGHGHQVAGEIAVARAYGTSGNLQQGLWRCGPTSPGCQSDGSLRVRYSAPLGDECLVVLDGEATVSVVSSGEQYHLSPGTIMCHPKGLELTLDVKPPFFKKYYVIWDSPQVAAPSKQIIIANINDNPEKWQKLTWQEAEGPQDCGEHFFIRNGGSTGTMRAGIWRSGVGIHGCRPDGSSTVPYTGPAGDETNLILEGQVHVRCDETGQEYDYQAGDMMGFSMGSHLTWTAKGPFVKKFFVITNTQLPVR
jgi:uncharacterized cupin superfamily protein